MASYTIHNPGYTENETKYVAGKGAFLIKENFNNKALIHINLWVSNRIKCIS